MTKPNMDAIRARIIELAALMGDPNDSAIALGAMIESKKVVVTWEELRALLAQHDADQGRIKALEDALVVNGLVDRKLSEIGETAHSAMIASDTGEKSTQMHQLLVKISQAASAAKGAARDALKGGE